MFGRVDAARMEFPAASSQTQIIKKESSPRLVSPQMIGAIDYPDDIARRGTVTRKKTALLAVAKRVLAMTDLSVFGIWDFLRISGFGLRISNLPLQGDRYAGAPTGIGSTHIGRVSRGLRLSHNLNRSMYR